MKIPQQRVRKWKFVQLNLELARATRQCTATSILPPHPAIISGFILNRSCLSSQSLFYCCNHLCKASVLTFDVTNLVAEVLKQWQTPEKNKKKLCICVCVRAVASPETFDLYPASVCVWHPLTPCVPGRSEPALPIKTHHFHASALMQPHIPTSNSK